jgi:hypothetical protein
MKVTVAELKAMRTNQVAFVQYLWRLKVYKSMSKLSRCVGVSRHLVRYVIKRQKKTKQFPWRELYDEWVYKKHDRS